MIQNKRTLVMLGLLLVVAVGSYAFLEWQASTPAKFTVKQATTTSDRQATTTEEAPEESSGAVPPTSSSHGYGTATIRLNEAASFPGGLSIRPLAVLEDSRCPADVRCIQAGTVRLSLRVRSGTGVSTNVLTLGSSVTTEAEEITLLRVAPENVSGRSINNADYRFTFEVTQREAPPPPPPAQGACYVGGCSGQLCTNSPGAVSTCEFRAEYACYRTATCERQPSGQCGWTPTEELLSCLANPPEAESPESREPSEPPETD